MAGCPNRSVSRASTKLKIMDWPLLRRPFASAFALSMALSFGDFGIVALFGGTELRTLPYLLYERLGAYRLDEASADRAVHPRHGVLPRPGFRSVVPC